MRKIENITEKNVVKTMNNETVESYIARFDNETVQKALSDYFSDSDSTEKLVELVKTEYITIKAVATIIVFDMLKKAFAKSKKYNVIYNVAYEYSKDYEKLVNNVHTIESCRFDYIDIVYCNKAKRAIQIFVNYKENKITANFVTSVAKENRVKFEYLESKLQLKADSKKSCCKRCDIALSEIVTLAKSVLTVLDSTIEDLQKAESEKSESEKSE